MTFIRECMKQLFRRHCVVFPTFQQDGAEGMTRGIEKGQMLATQLRHPPRLKLLFRPGDVFIWICYVFYDCLFRRFILKSMSSRTLDRSCFEAVKHTASMYQCPSLSLSSPSTVTTPPYCIQEHTIFPHAVSALVDGRVSWREDGVPILWSDSQIQIGKS